MEASGLCLTISNNNKNIKNHMNLISSVFLWPGNFKYSNFISGKTGSLQVSGAAAGEMSEVKMTKIAEKV